MAAPWFANAPFHASPLVVAAMDVVAAAAWVVAARYLLHTRRHHCPQDSWDGDSSPCLAAAWENCHIRRADPQAGAVLLEKAVVHRAAVPDARDDVEVVAVVVGDDDAVAS